MFQRTRTPLPPVTRKSIDLPLDVTNILHELHKITRITTSLKSSSLAYVSGYILETMKFENMCLNCLDSLSAPQSFSPLLSLIAFQDRGGLTYPTPDFVFILSIIEKFVENAVKILPLTNVANNLMTYIIPNLLKCPVLKCTEENHNERIAKHICSKFLPLLLKNIAGRVVIRPNILNKPRSRKVLKFS